MFRSTRFFLVSLALGGLLLGACGGSEEDPTGERPDLKLVGGKADVPSWLRHIPVDWGCDQTLTGAFGGWDSAHLYSFPGKLGYEYTFTFGAKYAWYRGAAIAIYDAETGARVALARNAKDSSAKLVYRAERSVKYLVAVYSLWWYAKGPYTLRADCTLIARTCQTDANCNADEFCKLEACGQAQQGIGTCEAITHVCPEIFAPTCGCDGRDYGNACQAAQHGISVAHTGFCPKLTVDPVKAPLGQPFTATLENNSQFEDIFLAGCSPLSLQQLVAGAWQDRGPLKVCVWEGNGVVVAPKTSWTDSSTPAQAGTYRFVGDYSVGCEKGKPLSAAKCTLYRKLLSPEFVVEQSSCTGAWLDQKGNCRTPADGVYPDSCCADQLKTQCADLNAAYVKAREAARPCSLVVAQPVCTFLVAMDLTCNVCPRYINLSPDAAGLTKLSQQYDDLRCQRVLVPCPKYMCPPATGATCQADPGSADGVCVPTF